MILFLLFLLISPLRSFDVLKKMNVLYVGESLRVDGKDIKKVTVSNSRIIKVSKGDGHALLINARRKGSVSIHLWTKGNSDPKRYGFTIMSAEIYRRLLATREALKEVKGIKITNAGEYVYITGVVSKKADIELISKITSSQKKVMNYVRLSKDVEREQYGEITNNLIKLGLYDVSARQAGNLLFVEGSGRTRSSIENARYYLKTNYPGGRFDLTLIPYQIDIDVKIVEISRTESRDMGLDVPGQFNISRHTVMSKIEIDSILNLAQRKGSAKILSNPSLSANDGETAVFHAGGTIPIRLTSRFSSNLTWKNYGVILNFTPRVLSDDTVELSIVSEFSNVDETNSNDDIPGFLIRKVKTVVTMDSGKTVVISGLIHKDKGKSNSGIPLISDIPILSDIFSLNSVHAKESELAVIVTPAIRFRCEEFFIDKKLEDLLIETLGEDV